MPRSTPNTRTGNLRKSEPRVRALLYQNAAKPACGPGKRLGTSLFALKTETVTVLQIFRATFTVSNQRLEFHATPAVAPNPDHDDSIEPDFRRGGNLAALMLLACVRAKGKYRRPHRAAQAHLDFSRRAAPAQTKPAP